MHAFYPKSPTVSRHVIVKGTMPLEIRQRESEGITIIDVKGRLVTGPDAGDMRREVSSLVERGFTNVILNLEDVDYIDSTGLGTLVIAHSSFEKAGGALKLLHVSKRAAQLLILTKLSTVFSMFDNEQAAIDSFFPDREARRFDILEFVRSHDNQQEDLDKQQPPQPKPNQA